jgi:hypothetical protein
MNGNTGKNLDDLLRKALADDLPPDVAAGMRERMERFRARKTEGKPEAAAGPWAWFFRRGVWATLSILLLVAGILLQGRGSSSPLADRISSVKAAFSSLETTRR